MPKPSPINETPTAPAFRAWLTVALDLTKLKAAPVSRGIGAHVNLINVFLRDPARDITLSRAADIERFLRAAAADLRVSLPNIDEVAIDEGVRDV